MKRNFLRYFTLLLVLGLIFFAGCSKSDKDLQTTPNNDVKAVLTTSNETVPVDCSDWTWAQLNEWGQSIAQNLTCEEFNERVREDECFKKWFHEWIEKEKAAGSLTLVETKTFYADEHTTGPNCGVVDEGNNNCFNGDFEKLNAWVQKIIDRGNEKEIINKSNHNPCMRLWMRQMGLLVEDMVDKTVVGIKYEQWTSYICLSGCDHCRMTTTSTEYADGTYKDTETYECLKISTP